MRVVEPGRELLEWVVREVVRVHVERGCFI
jgi:hypothetical protein